MHQAWSNRIGRGALALAAMMTPFAASAQPATPGTGQPAPWQLGLQGSPRR